MKITQNGKIKLLQTKLNRNKYYYLSKKKMQDYLKKYLDVPSKTKKTNESKVVYRSQVSVIDNDNFDVTMGRLVDGMEDEFDYKPVFVETNESRKLDVN
jgi:hypothetical protein